MTIIYIRPDVFILKRVHIIAHAVVHDELRVHPSSGARITVLYSTAYFNNMRNEKLCIAILLFIRKELQTNVSNGKKHIDIIV